MKNKWLKMIIAVAAILSVLGATLVLACLLYTSDAADD